jgi:hypothetical protein
MDTDLDLEAVKLALAELRSKLEGAEGEIKSLRSHVESAIDDYTAEVENALTDLSTVEDLLGVVQHDEEAEEEV